MTIMNFSKRPMGLADTIPNTSRRWFLGGMAQAAVAIPAISTALATSTQNANAEPFSHPSEYLAAMQAIGWRSVAMFGRRHDDDQVYSMGVKESAPSEQAINETWDKFHAIQMRMPVQRASDLPQGEWWSRVWHHLYDIGLRENVTHKQAIEEI